MSENNNQQLQTLDSNIIASLVINGDLAKLSPEQKVSYYRQFCERLGLDPISQPFKLLKLSGKETLYCDRGGASQLCRVHGVSHEIKNRETIQNCYIVTAQAIDMTGRHTESTGAVNIEGLKGEALCNAMMKAETKAKRRATLDLLGLGMLDETEVESMPQSETADFQITDKEAELKEAISQLTKCDTVPLLTQYKNSLPKDISAQPLFKEAALSKYNSLINQPA
jgi:hypothetical protein